ncbi:uncharacterized protein C9orf43 homolog [Rhea pennata]|uniref:uncharacterized protein C9orf43 homolog n=1 Tax=Rhea pennata TaxID=8795 RepID=UPI002E275385
MMTTDVSQWDETICDEVLCQHPQCWDTLRRIEEGRPRIRLRNSDSISRMFLESEDEFPTLKILNMPTSQSLRRCIRCSKCHRTFSISAAPSLLNSVLQESSNEDSIVSSERPIFPGLNSAAGSNVISPRQMSFMVLNNIGKRRMKSRKIPAGGQPSLVYPKRSQILSNSSKTRKSLLDYKTEGFADKDGVLSQSCPGQLQIATVVELQDEGGLKLMSRQPGLSQAKSKSSRPLLIQKAPVMVNLKERSSQRIKNSQYLRKPTKIKTRPDSMPLCLFSKLEEEPDYLDLFAFPAGFLQCCMDRGPEQPHAQLDMSLKTGQGRVPGRWSWSVCPPHRRGHAVPRNPPCRSRGGRW